MFLINQAFRTEDGPVPAQSLALELARIIDQGMHEDLDITNHSQKPVRFNLEIAVRSDFADLFDVKVRRTIRRGRITSKWSELRQTLTTNYQNADFARSVAISVGDGDARAVFANGRMSFEVSVPLGGRWHCCLLYEFITGEHAIRHRITA